MLGTNLLNAANQYIWFSRRAVVAELVDAQR